MTTGSPQTDPTRFSCVTDKLKEDIGVILVPCLQELVELRPSDPIDFIAKWLYNYTRNRTYFQEKTEFARALHDTAKGMCAEKARHVKNARLRMFELGNLQAMLPAKDALHFSESIHTRRRHAAQKRKATAANLKKLQDAATLSGSTFEWLPWQPRQRQGEGMLSAGTSLDKSHRGRSYDASSSSWKKSGVSSFSFGGARSMVTPPSSDVRGKVPVSRSSKEDEDSFDSFRQAYGRNKMLLKELSGATAHADVEDREWWFDHGRRQSVVQKLEKWHGLRPISPEEEYMNQVSRGFKRYHYAAPTEDHIDEVSNSDDHASSLNSDPIQRLKKDFKKGTKKKRHKIRRGTASSLKRHVSTDHVQASEDKERKSGGDEESDFSLEPAKSSESYQESHQKDQPSHPAHANEVWAHSSTFSSGKDESAAGVEDQSGLDSTPSESRRSTYKSSSDAPPRERQHDTPSGSRYTTPRESRHSTPRESHRSTSSGSFHRTPEESHHTTPRGSFDITPTGSQHVISIYHDRHRGHHPSHSRLPHASTSSAGVKQSAHNVHQGAEMHKVSSKRSHSKTRSLKKLKSDLRQKITEPGYWYFSWKNHEMVFVHPILGELRSRRQPSVQSETSWKHYDGACESWYDAELYIVCEPPANVDEQDRNRLLKSLGLDAPTDTYDQDKSPIETAQFD